MDVDPSAFLEPLIVLAKTTGVAILDFYYKSRQFPIRSKADASPLTQADLLAHEMIVAGLTQLTPDIPVLSEEDPEISLATRKNWHRYWLIDPVDGTKEFIRHSGEFAINIALIENHYPVLGLIYAPVMEKLFFACKSHGAFKQEGQNKAEKITTRTWSPDNLIVALGQNYKLGKLKELLASFGHYEVISMGSSLKFGIIAEGKADIYPRVGDTFEWDTAAGQIIVEEAGGAVVDFTLQPLQYNAKESLLNPHFLAVGDKKILEQLKRAIAREQNL